MANPSPALVTTCLWRDSLYLGRIEGMEMSEKEDVDARPGERCRGWLKGDTQMHLNLIRRGLVNFFPTGAVCQAGSNLRQAETTPELYIQPPIGCFGETS